MIDELLKTLEKPVINPAVVGKSFPRIATDVPLLAMPARRRVEVLVYSQDKKWWRQRGLNSGETKTKIYLGDERTRRGTQFTVVAMTTDDPLKDQTYLSLPDHRTMTREIILKRG